VPRAGRRPRAAQPAHPGRTTAIGSRSQRPARRMCRAAAVGRRADGRDAHQRAHGRVGRRPPHARRRPGLGRTRHPRPRRAAHGGEGSAADDGGARHVRGSVDIRPPAPETVHVATVALRGDAHVWAQQADALGDTAALAESLAPARGGHLRGADRCLHRGATSRRGPLRRGTCGDDRGGRHAQRGRRHLRRHRHEHALRNLY